jgi:hypothetical protein
MRLQRAGFGVVFFGDISTKPRQERGHARYASDTSSDPAAVTKVRIIYNPTKEII